MFKVSTHPFKVTSARYHGGILVHSTRLDHGYCSIILIFIVIFCFIDFNVDSVLYGLQKAKFPPHKWKSLASGLRKASLIPSIEANNVKDTVGMLQELIYRWVGSTTGNQWVMLIDAVVMCDEPAVAQELATAVGCPLARSGTTTQHV